MEEIGLHIVFEESKIRGSKETQYLIRATEEGIGIDVNNTIGVKNWEEIKKDFPTLEHILQEFSYDPNWNAEWRHNERILYIETIAGHEGLYEYNGDVTYQCGTELEELEKEKVTKAKKVVK